MFQNQLLGDHPAEILMKPSIVKGFSCCRKSNQADLKSKAKVESQNKNVCKLATIFCFLSQFDYYFLNTFQQKKKGDGDIEKKSLAKLLYIV